MADPIIKVWYDYVQPKSVKHSYYEEFWFTDQNQADARQLPLDSTTRNVTWFSTDKPFVILFLITPGSTTQCYDHFSLGTGSYYFYSGNWATGTTPPWAGIMSDDPGTGTYTVQLGIITPGPRSKVPFSYTIIPFDKDATAKKVPKVKAVVRATITTFTLTRSPGP